jgi:maltose phosphorylase
VSSLSSSIHAILAGTIGYSEKAYGMYLRTSRLDLDDYNNDTSDGLHITSMGGTWMSFVIGFGGLRVRNDILKINPFIPAGWKSYSFKVMFRGTLLKIIVSQELIEIINYSESSIKLNLSDNIVTLNKNSTTVFEHLNKVK